MSDPLARPPATRERSRFRPLAVAVVAHALLVGGIVVAGSGRADEPEEAPRLFTFRDIELPPATVAEETPVPPPPAPAPESPPVIETEPEPDPDPVAVAQPEPRDPEPSPVVVPTEAEEPARPEPPATPGGVEGGVAGGVEGGEVGAPLVLYEGHAPAGVFSGEIPLRHPDRGAELVEDPLPDYPGRAVRFGIEGEVVLEAIIDLDGAVRDVRVVRELSHGCTEAAVEAVRKRRYRPAEHAGRPVAQILDITITFRLE